MDEIVLVYVSDLPEFQDDKVFCKEYSLQFWGMTFVVELKRKLSDLGIRMISTQQAKLEISKTGSKYYLVSEFHSENGKALCRLGATPLISYSFESPIVTYSYTKDLLQSKFEYKYYLGLSNLGIKGLKLEALGFPSFSRDVLKARIRSIENRESTDARFNKISYVASNKQFHLMPSFILYKNPINQLRQLRSFILYFYSQLLIRIKFKALHKNRLEIIKLLVSEGVIDVAGAGWGDINCYPRQYRGLVDEIKNIYCGLVEDKIAFMSKYNFALCIENTIAPGYVTEKVVHAMISGAIPVYLGNNNQESGLEIPSNCFIEIHANEGWKGLFGKLALTSSEMEDYRINILEFLKEYGDRYTFEGVSSRFLEVVKRELNV